jgi:type VI secretion system secreted protein Hcp
MAVYVKFAAIKKGESEAEGHKGSDGWLEVGSVSFGAGRSISTPVGAATKREASAPRISEVQISKLQDSTSPLLFQESLIGKAGDCQIDLTQTGEKKLEVYCTIKLTNAMISSYSLASSGDRPSESIAINFTKIEYTYQGYKNTGEPDSALKQTVTYDLTTAQNK